MIIQVHLIIKQIKLIYLIRIGITHIHIRIDKFQIKCSLVKNLFLQIKLINRIKN